LSTQTRSQLGRFDAIVGGEPINPGAYFDDVDPATGATLAEVARCGPAEVDAAVDCARTTFEVDWRRRSPAERASALTRIASAIRRDREQLERLECLDTGKPLTQARTDIEVAARYFDFYAHTVEAMYGSTIPLGESVFAFTLREPHGVTAHIVPWNYPAQMCGRTIAPALAAGNCCVLKPAEEASLTALRIAELALEAGLPAGAFNVVTGLGEEAGASLAAHPGIDHLSFTGSNEVGRLVAKATAENTVPVTVELGGKSPNVVFADADLERAMPVIVRSIIQNAGQTCSAGSRLLIEEAAHDRVIEAVAGGLRGVAVGPGIEDPDMGPLITARQLARVEQLVDEGRDSGVLVLGGRRPDEPRLRDGFFFEPTLLDGVPVDAPIAQEEVFGPVLVASTFGDPEEAARLANATGYGLVAGIWTRDISVAHVLVREIQAGQVFVNSYGAGGGVELPFGGRKRSGHGREKGIEGMLAFTRTKSVAIGLG
jgi:aldehyde dehydrogenase (NAD+)